MSNENKVHNPSTRSNEMAGSAMPATSSTEQSPVTLSDTLRGTDPPIEAAHPGLQPALVFASYPIALIVMIAVLAGYFLFFRAAPMGKDSAPVPVEATK